MIVQKNLITDARGNIVFTAIEDNEPLAKLVHQERQGNKGWTEDRSAKLMLSIPPYVYQKYCDELGPECWNDRGFLIEFSRMRPEFAI